MTSTEPQSSNTENNPDNKVGSLDIPGGFILWQANDQESKNTENEQTQEEVSKTARLQLSTIYQRNGIYIVNCTPLAIDTVEFLKKHKNTHILQTSPNISINEPSGSGKTCFFECMDELSDLNQDNVHYKLAGSLGLISKAIEVFDTVLVLNLKFKDALNKLATTRSNIEEKFILNLSSQLISLLEDKLLIVDRRYCEYNRDSLEAFKKDLVNPPIFSEPEDRLIHQQHVHKMILKFIMIGVTKGIFYKEQTHLEGNENEQDETKKEKLSNPAVEIEHKIYKRVEKVVLLIDEINLFKSKEIYSETVKKGNQHRNFYVQIIDDAMKADTNGQSITNLSCIFSSISPLSKETNSKSQRIKILDFADILLKMGHQLSFAEITYVHFNKIAKENHGLKERKTEPNKLQVLIDDIKKNKKAIVDYFTNKKHTEEKELKEIIDEIFGPDYKEKVDDEKIEDEIIGRVCRFFAFLFNQSLFSIKHDSKHMLGCYKKFVSYKDGEVLPELKKINCNQFMAFLMRTEKKGSICLYSKQNPSTENNMESFWHNYHIFYTRFEKPFPRPISEPEIQILYGPVDDVSLDSVSQTLYDTFHYGYTMLKPRKLDNGKFGVELDFPNYQQKMIMHTQYQGYLNELNSECKFNYTQRGELMQTFKLAFWKKTIMPIIQERVNQGMMVEFNENIDEALFREATESYLNKILPDQIRYACPSVPKDEIKEFFQVFPEIKVSKDEILWQKTSNAQIDLLIILHAHNNKENRCVVIIELKINAGKPRNLGTLTEYRKNYQTLDLDKYGHKIYVSASLNKKDTKWVIDNKATMESFTDDNI